MFFTRLFFKIKSFLLNTQYNLYEKQIINTLGCIPKVNGEYDIFNSKTLEIHPNDIDSFTKLFPVLINNNYGNGELALYWLFREQGIDFDSIGNNDMKMNDNPIEIKKYLNKKLIKIGKIPISKKSFLVKLQHLLFQTRGDYLISHLNKKIINEIILHDDSELVSEIKDIFKTLVIETLIAKIGNLGYIINFRSPTKADIYNIDINYFEKNFDSVLKYTSFNEEYLHLELEKILRDEKKPTNRGSKRKSKISHI